MRRRRDGAPPARAAERLAPGAASELRRPLERVFGLDAALAPPTRADRFAFARWAALAVAIVWGPLVPLAVLGWWWLG